MANLNKFVKADVGLDIQRSRLDRSFGHTTSLKSGDLVPCFVDEILPGDTVRIDYSMVTRMLTPVAPVFGNAYFDIWFFFIPNRLIADYGSYKKVWQQLQGENTSGYWANSTEMVLEKLGFYRCNSMSVANYLGLPIIGGTSKKADINSLPFKAYTLVWNEFFRDQNVEAPKDINTYGIYSSGNFKIDIGDVTLYGHPDSILKVAKLHDYFTSCLPYPQKGDAVKVGTSGLAPVLGLDSDGDEEAIKLVLNGTTTNAGDGTLQTTSGVLEDYASQGLNFKNVYADLSQATAATINNLRQAFA